MALLPLALVVLLSIILLHRRGPADHAVNRDMAVGAASEGVQLGARVRTSKDVLSDPALQPKLASPRHGAAVPALRVEQQLQSYDPALDSFEVLSQRWVETYFYYCRLPQMASQCAGSMQLALAISSEGKPELDSWPYRMEYELVAFVEAVRERYGIESATTACNRYGCLLYLAGTIPQFFSRKTGDFAAFAQELREHAWIDEFAWVTDPLRPKPQRRFYLVQKWADYWRLPGDMGFLLVFKRQGGDVTGRDAQSHRKSE